MARRDRGGERCDLFDLLRWVERVVFVGGICGVVVFLIWDSCAGATLYVFSTVVYFEERTRQRLAVDVVKVLRLLSC